MDSRHGELGGSVKQEIDQRETELDRIKERVKQIVDLFLKEQTRPVQSYGLEEWSEILVGMDFCFQLDENSNFCDPERVRFGLLRCIERADALEITEQTADEAQVTMGFPFFVIHRYRDRYKISFQPKISVSLRKTETFIEPKVEVLDLFVRLIDPNFSSVNTQFRDNSFDAKDKRSEFFDSFVRDIQTLPFSEAKTYFENIPKKTMIDIALSRQEVFNKLVSAYVEQMNFVVAEADELKSLRQGLNQLPNFGFSDSNLLTNDVLRMIPREDRFAFSIYRNRSISEVKDDLEQRAKALMVRDGERNQFHRWVEFFGFLFFHGMSPEQVRWVIDMKRSVQTGEAIPLTENIFVECEASPLHGLDSEGPTYRISFGDGDAYESVSWDSPWGARILDDSYKSKVRKGRTFREDEKLVDGIASGLQSLFPLLVVKSLFYEMGSYHERFRYFNLEINANSLFLVGKSCGKSPEAVRDEIFSFIREEIKKVQSPAKTE